MRRIIFALFVTCFAVASVAQQIKGFVISGTGEALPYATVFVHETSLGIITDAGGAFQATLSPGSYTVEARFLGYETQTKSIEIKQGVTTNISFTLKEKTLALNEVTVRPGKGNPADEIVRRSMAKAPYHLYQVQSFNSENYLKGSVKIENVPSVMKMLIKDKKIKSLIGQVLVLESQNKITFRSPSRYTQQVVAYKSSIPKEFEPKGGGLSIATSNIYNNKYGGYISPLSVRAFQYYRYKLVDISDNDKRTIYKIQVTPKIKGAELCSGFLYITDNDWSVFSLDLSVTETGTTTQHKVYYQEIEPGLFMPITYNTYTTINTMGVKGFARFYSSVKYQNIKLNASAGKVKADLKQPAFTEQTASKSVTKKQERAQALISKISAKEKLTTADAIKLAKLTRETVEPNEAKNAQRNLEIRDSSLVQFQFDSLAAFRDSVYWETVRNVPLLADEAESFNRKDTLPPSKSVKTTSNSIEITLGGSGNKRKGINSLLFGSSFHLADSVQLGYSGLLAGILKEYNFVDGFWLGQKLNLNVKLPGNTSLSVTPGGYYTTARKSLNWNTEVAYRYRPLSDGQLTFSIGNSTYDIQGNAGTPRLLNSLSSLLAGDNVIRFYQNQTLKIGNKLNVANGLMLALEASYEQRKLLSNHTGLHFWGMDPRPNSPDLMYSAAFPENTSTGINAYLEFTPQQRYRIKNGHKESAGSVYPTFTLNFHSAFRVNDSKEQAEYNLLKLGIKQNIKLGEWSELSYQTTTGTFLSKNKLYAPDYNYFRTSPLWVVFGNQESRFTLLPNYTYSNSQWAELHTQITSEYLLLKRIGFLQNAGFKESLLFNFLYNNDLKKPYYEAGYSIKTLGFFNAGISCSFQGLKFQDAGVKVSIPIGL